MSRQPHGDVATFSELANLSADVVAKVEDSKEARPAMRPRIRRSKCFPHWAHTITNRVSTRGPRYSKNTYHSTKNGAAVAPHESAFEPLAGDVSGSRM